MPGQHRTLIFALRLLVIPSLATVATVTVSSQNTAAAQLGIKAIDGIVDGSPGDFTKEWADAGPDSWGLDQDELDQLRRW